MSRAIRTDVASRIDELEGRLVPELRPLAGVAYNYRWSWAEDGPAVFTAIDRHRWRLAGENPVQFLLELSRERQHAAAADPALVERVDRLAREVAAESELPQTGSLDGPVAFFCAEFGLHASLPIYSGGLGVLAGDFLKEASDRALPLIGIGLFYRRGYFSQRFDLSGVQQEYWLEHDPQLLPLSLVHGADGAPLRLSVSVFDRTIAFAVWCVQVGRVPLLLLDAELAENDPVARWTTARLYDGNRQVRLTQYGLLGMGGARVLEALGIEPSLLHLNEGHPALAPLELAARRVEGGATLDEALESMRDGIVFTTHTPVPAGNETYPPALFREAFGQLAPRLGLGEAQFLDLCRTLPGNPADEPGMSALAMRIAGKRNGVSRLHGEVARDMWKPMFRNAGAPIDHVTNGVHVPTFIGGPMCRLLETYLGEDWQARAADPAVWAAVRAIPNAELWRARNESRRRLVEFAREKAVSDRLLRGEELEYAEAGVRALDPDALTFGFARRLTAYKRLALLVADPQRAQRILSGPPAVQLFVAGKAHPRDDEGKRLLQSVATLWREIEPQGDRVWFLDNYNLSIGRELVIGCDVWLNVPMRGLEASGTSGMKAVYNGGLQLSVLDGWWAEAFNGTNGWAISGAGDREDAAELYTLIETEVIPLFYARDDEGVPNGWCERMKESLVTLGPAFNATRMLDDYAERVYRRFQKTVVSQ